MIHLTNQQLSQAVESALSETYSGKLGEHDRQQFITASVLAMARLLTALGVKGKEESLSRMEERLKEPDRSYDLLNDVDRELVMQMLFEMYEPMGAKRFVIIALSDESAPIVCPIQKIGDTQLTNEKVRGICQFIAENETNEQIQL